MAAMHQPHTVQAPGEVVDQLPKPIQFKFLLKSNHHAAPQTRAACELETENVGTSGPPESGYDISRQARIEVDA